MIRLTSNDVTVYAILYLDTQSLSPDVKVRLLDAQFNVIEYLSDISTEINICLVNEVYLPLTDWQKNGGEYPFEQDADLLTLFNSNHFESTEPAQDETADVTLR